MKRDLYRELSWLPVAPADFKGQCRAALDSTNDFGQRIKKLSRFALNDNDLIRLAKTISSGADRGLSLSPLRPLRLGLAGNGTSEFITPAIAATAPRHGLGVTCVSAGYDQVLQECISAESSLNRFKPEVVLLALDWRTLPLRTALGDAQVARATVESTLDFFDTLRQGLRQHGASICIVQNLAAPPERAFGSLDRKLEGTLRSLIDEVNAGLSLRLRESTDILFDVAGLAETVGLANWHSPSEWNLAKLPFSQAYLPLYADHVCRLLAAQRGLSRRCLILDLDNTLWGGVIGDDGLKGIQIGQGDPAGEAYLNFQQYVLSLRERGIVLAVSSKNEDANARLPFREHADMLLREEHFAVFQANWNDKAANIQAIAETLSLGLDSLTFVDDNPFEREFVRKVLPDVAVPEMSEDPADYARTLSAAGYFEAVSFAAEDLQRANYYAQNARRATLQSLAGDIEAYLASLGMEIEFQPFNETGQARITQLINKSNQFNLTTRRYSEAEVARFQNDPQALTLQARLRDQLGDNGMISVVICRFLEAGVGEIDTWLMSCRVLGRRVEDAVLLELIAHASRRGIYKLRGLYRPTGRNKLVERHYAKLGFTQVETKEDGTTIWELDTKSIDLKAPPMVVKRIGFEAVASGMSHQECV